MGYIEDIRKLVGHRRLILCGSSVVIRNEKGELLLQERRHPAGRWAFPGGPGKEPQADFGGLPAE